MWTLSKTRYLESELLPLPLKVSYLFPDARGSLLDGGAAAESGLCSGRYSEVGYFECGG
jgi:hypothetical protein